MPFVLHKGQSMIKRSNLVYKGFLGSLNSNFDFKQFKMAAYDYKKLKNSSNFNQICYIRIFSVPEYKFGLKIQKFQMAGSKCPPNIIKE